MISSLIISGGGQHICLWCGLIKEFWGIEMKYTGDREISSPPHKYSFILHVFCSHLQKSQLVDSGLIIEMLQNA